MIPRIIHYCWFGGTRMPEQERAYIEGWKRLLPDYEIRRWDESNFPLDYNTYTREAAQMRQWAFVADVCRLHALVTCGGIYLDTDMELIDSLDPFLADCAFLGEEFTGPCCGVMGSEADAVWLHQFLSYYSHRHFISALGHPTRTPNPVVLQRRVLPALAPYQKPVIYPSEVFYPTLEGPARTPLITERTVAIHHYAASWRRRRTLATRLRTLVLGLRYRYF